MNCIRVISDSHINLYFVRFTRENCKKRFFILHVGGPLRNIWLYGLSILIGWWHVHLNQVTFIRGRPYTWFPWQRNDATWWSVYWVIGFADLRIAEFRDLRQDIQNQRFYCFSFWDVTYLFEPCGYKRWSSFPKSTKVARRLKRTESKRYLAEAETYNCITRKEASDLRKMALQFTRTLDNSKMLEVRYISELSTLLSKKRRLNVFPVIL